MLEKISLHNFKSHLSSEFVLDNSRLHCLVGQNSSGKTSMLQAIHSLSLLANGLVTEDIFKAEKSPEDLVTVGKDNFSVMVVGNWNYSDRIHWSVGYEWKHILSEWQPTVSISLDGKTSQYLELDGSLAHEAFYPVPNSFRSTAHLKMVASNLAAPAYSDEITPQVEYDGSGLAPTLDYLRTASPKNFQQIIDKLRQVVPGVRSINVHRAKVSINRQRTIEIDKRVISYADPQEITGQEITFDMNTGKQIPAHAVSEGTILTLGLLTVLMNPSQPNLILLDDVEQGLHPTAQRELVTVFKEVLKSEPTLQIIFSTHSPYIVDELQPSQVHVLSNSNLGYTVTKRLDEHPDAEWATKALSTGQFWDAEGEDWIVAGSNHA